MVKNIPANAAEVGSIPGQEDPLEKEMATYSSILAWEIPWTEEPGRLQSMRSKKRHNLTTKQQQNSELMGQLVEGNAIWAIVQAKISETEAIMTEMCPSLDHPTSFLIFLF